MVCQTDLFSKDAYKEDLHANAKFSFKIQNTLAVLEWNKTCGVALFWLENLGIIFLNPYEWNKKHAYGSDNIWKLAKPTNTIMQANTDSAFVHRKLVHLKSIL